MDGHSRRFAFVLLLFLALPLSRLAAQTPCGGPPNYCATTSRNVVPETPMAPPPVNTPFRDPDFHSLMVRATDADTAAEHPGSGDNLVGVSYTSAPSGQSNWWSVFDPHIGTEGGYRFIVASTYGFFLPFELDVATMKTSRAAGEPGGVVGTRWFLPFNGGMSFSYKNPDLLFGTHGTRLESYDFATDNISLVYDFSRCPHLPGYVSKPNLHVGGFTSGVDDNRFSYDIGGSEQDNTQLTVFYDRAANGGDGACYWYDTKTAMTGGTNMPPAPIAGGVGQLPPPARPVVAAMPGYGQLPAGNYYVKITALAQVPPDVGETTPSPEAGPIHLASPGSLVVRFPALQNPYNILLAPLSGCGFKNRPGCRPVNVYIGTEPGREVLQTPGGVGGASYTQSTRPTKHAKAPPAASTAGYSLHDTRLTKGGNEVDVNSAWSGSIYFWIPGTRTVAVCLFHPPAGELNERCGGHFVLGYSHMINAAGVNSDIDLFFRAIARLSDWRNLIVPTPQPVQWTMDNHWTWNNTDPADTVPVCGTLVRDEGPRGDGTQDPLTSAVLQIREPWDREVVCVATHGPSTVWRFAHDRATATNNANAKPGSNFAAEAISQISQDGKFMLFGSDWDWSLGSEKGSSGCPSSGRCRTDVFIVELH
jgi:hypothetical protein